MVGYQLVRISLLLCTHKDRTEANLHCFSSILTCTCAHLVDRVLAGLMLRASCDVQVRESNLDQVDASRASRFLDLLNNPSESPGRILAADIIKQVFEHHPSPSGNFGDIPIGRE